MLIISRFAFSLVTVGFNFLPLLVPDSLKNHIPFWQTGMKVTVGYTFSFSGEPRRWIGLMPAFLIVLPIKLPWSSPMPTSSPLMRQTRSASPDHFWILFQVVCPDCTRRMGCKASALGLYIHVRLLTSTGDGYKVTFVALLGLLLTSVPREHIQLLLQPHLHFNLPPTFLF